MTHSASAEGDVLVERLLQAAAYHHAVRGPITLVETHISRVFLTGEFAYKVKKPVRLAFLDYSTLEQRRACCNEELRLNRRYAPDIYVAVSPVAGPAAMARVDGTGSAVEYAVKMRQFDRDDELDALVEAGRVDAGLLAALGERIAAFHTVAAAVNPVTAFGRPDPVQRVVLENFAELRRLPEAATHDAVLDDVEQWVVAEHGRTRELLQSRRDSGRVRECHGDLHCGNVVRWNGELTPFDGIEFDPALRFIDVASDLAFLTMDLSVRGRDDLRHAMLQAWVERTGDFQALRLLPRFEVYRALVRAKVATLRALQQSPGTAERHDGSRLAMRYVDWAWSRARRRQPALLLTCGYSGSGKTWLSRSLAAELPALHLRSDVERKRLAGLGAMDDSRSPLDGGIYTPEYTRRTYDRLRDCAEDSLRGGEGIIVDAAFLRRDERERMLDLAGRLGLRAAILHCVAPDEVLRERVGRRSMSANDASEAGLATLQRQPGFWEDFGKAELERIVTVDTTAPDAVATCRSALRRIGAD
jgi:uncharacterized protein